MRTRVVRLLAVVGVSAVMLGLSGCGAPPALTKAQIDSKKLSSNHPKLTTAQEENCRSCHKEAPAIKKQP